jgi:hypothetical protein
VVVQAGELDEEARWRSPAWQAGLAAAGAGNGARVLQHSLAWVRLEGHWRRAPLLLAMVVAVRATHHDCAVEVRDVLFASLHLWFFASSLLLSTSFLSFLSLLNCQLADPTGRLGAVVHREAAEPRAAELQPGAVLLLRAVSCFSAAGAHHLNVVPSALAALFPATTASGAASGAAAIDSLPADWRGLDSYVRVPTRPKRPSSSSSSSFGARRGPVVPAPIAPTAPPERSAPAPGVAAARRALLRIPTVPNVRVPEILPPKPLPEAPAAAPATPGWNDADNALLLEYARLAEKSVSANGLRNSSSSVSSSSLSPAWNDEDDARLLELDLDTLVTKWQRLLFCFLVRWGVFGD